MREELGSGYNRLSCEELLGWLAHVRQEDEIVVTNQMSARIWPTMSRHEFDFNYLSSTMGGAVPLALGMALAKPHLHVTVLSGDGSLLMNLGSLTTVVASRATNLSVILLDNGLYEVTGGQPTAGSIAHVDYVGLAKSSGFEQAMEVASLDHWKQLLARRRSIQAAQFYWLKVGRISPSTPRDASTKVDVQLRKLRASLSDVP